MKLIYMYRDKSAKLTVTCILLCLMLCAMFSISANAATGATTTEQAQKNLTTYVQSKMMGNTYELEGGGYIAGSALFEGNATNGYDLNESTFGTLSKKAQTSAVMDISNFSKEAAEPNASGTGAVATGVSNQTVTSWWKQLQQKNGVGSRFLQTALDGTKPDFVTAGQIWQPFNGMIGTALGIMSIAILGLLGLVLAADICYAVLPPVRSFVADDGAVGKIPVSHIFSHDMIYAVKSAEQESGDGKPRHVLGIYLGRRIWMMVLLGICLLYLVSGQLYIGVGYIIDLLSGFLGF